MGCAECERLYERERRAIVEALAADRRLNEYSLRGIVNLNRVYASLQQELEDAERERALAINARVEHQKTHQ